MNKESQQLILRLFLTCTGMRFIERLLYISLHVTWEYTSKLLPEADKLFNVDYKDALLDMYFS